MYHLAIIWESLSADDYYCVFCFKRSPPNSDQTAKLCTTDQNMNHDSVIPKPFSCSRIIFWCTFSHNGRILVTRQLANLMVPSCGVEIIRKTYLWLRRLTCRSNKSESQRKCWSSCWVDNISRTKVNIGLDVDFFLEAFDNVMFECSEF